MTLTGLLGGARLTGVIAPPDHVGTPCAIALEPIHGGRRYDLFFEPDRPSRLWGGWIDDARPWSGAVRLERP
jgi:hypothetical protein